MVFFAIERLNRHGDVIWLSILGIYIYIRVYILYIITGVGDVCEWR